MEQTLRPRRDFAALEVRRRRAGQWFRQGHAQAEVVRRLRVSRPRAHRWYPAGRSRRVEGGRSGRTQTAAFGGRAAPTRGGLAGRPPRLGFSHRTVDTGTDRPSDHGAVFCALLALADLARAPAVRLEPPAPGTACPGTRRSGHRSLGTSPLAPGKKTPGG